MPVKEEDMEHKDVTAALAAVMAEIGGIGKMTSEERRARGLGGGEAGGGISYAYRGIDQIAAAAQPLLAKHGVVFVPKVTTLEVKEILINNRPWTDTFLTVEWLISGPNGTSLSGCTVGQGRDNADKGPNKAMTAAYKNMLLRVLCIGDPSDDTDGTTHEADERRDDPIKGLFERVKAAKGTPYAEALAQAAKENSMSLSEKGLAADAQWAAIVEAILDDPKLKGE